MRRIFFFGFFGVEMALPVRPIYEVVRQCGHRSIKIC